MNSKLDSFELNHLSKNQDYADIILSHINGIHSKMNSVSLYFYNSIILQDTVIKEAIENILKDELYHLKVLNDIAYFLGGDPRLWESHHDYVEYWSPSYNIYSSDIISILKNAIETEKYFIDFYKKNTIDDPIILDVFKKLLSDDQHHLKILQSLLDQL